MMPTLSPTLALPQKVAVKTGDATSNDKVGIMTILDFQHLCVIWRHDMGTISALLALCEGNPPVTGGFPSQTASIAGFDVSFYVSLNKLLNKLCGAIVLYEYFPTFAKNFNQYSIPMEPRQPSSKSMRLFLRGFTASRFD